jgi:hypothetical protein
LCRLCLEESETLFRLDSDFNILILDSGASVTIADALKYLDLNILIPYKKPKDDQSELDEEIPEFEEASGEVDDPSLPQVKELTSNFYK